MHRATLRRFATGGATLTLLAGVLAVGLSAPSAFSQDGARPVDQPQFVNEAELARFRAAIEPFVQMGRATYPLAKERYGQGLPAGYLFFVTTELQGTNGRFEQVFVRVVSIDDQTIEGDIASDIAVVSGYQRGDPLTLSENDVKDWTIAGPDGSEEGNFVGRFMDHYFPGRVLAAIMGFVVSESGIAHDIRVAQIVNDRGEPVNVDLPAAWIAAARGIIEDTQSTPTAAEVFVPLVYDPDRPSEPLVLGQ